MKNSKKIIFASALTLALSVGTILPENVKADDTNPTSSEEKVNDTVKLHFHFYLGDMKTNLKSGNNVIYINGVPHAIDSSDMLWEYYAKRGTTLDIKVKNSSETGAKYYAEGTFEVPKEGYKDNDRVNVILKEINKEETPVKPEDKKDESTDKKENDDKDNNVKPEDNKDNKGEKTENKDKKDDISDNKEEDKKEDKENEDNKENNKTENKNDDSNIDPEQKEDDKNKDSSSQKGNGMGAGPLEEDLDFKTYDTKEEAIEKAKEALKNNDKYNHYEIKTTEDGKYYYELSKKDDEPVKAIKVRKNTPKKIQTTGVQSTSNVKTGVSSLTSIIGIATTSLAALIISKKNK